MRDLAIGVAVLVFAWALIMIERDIVRVGEHLRTIEQKCQIGK